MSLTTCAEHSYRIYILCCLSHQLAQLLPFLKEWSKSIVFAAFHVTVIGLISFFVQQVVIRVLSRVITCFFEQASTSTPIDASQAPLETGESGLDIPLEMAKIDSVHSKIEYVYGLLYELLFLSTEPLHKLSQEEYASAVSTREHFIRRLYVSLFGSFALVKERKVSTDSTDDGETQDVGEEGESGSLFDGDENRNVDYSTSDF